MNIRFRLILLALVLVCYGIAIRLIHRKKLNLSYSLLWMFMLLLLLLMLIFPEAIYGLSALIGIDLPIHMLFTGFAFIAMALIFNLTCIVSRDNEKLRTLTQQLALLEKRVREMEERGKKTE